MTCRRTVRPCSGVLCPLVSCIFRLVENVLTSTKAAFQKCLITYHHWSQPI